jgi:3-deoxy-manno-octulosonate cytidylyltransferase (CMP-KDO synthetase)
MSRLIVIPARMGSSRFPGKPLAMISGKPMLQWVAEHAMLAVGRENVWIATCDLEITEFARQIGVHSVMTSAAHERATDRTSEAIGILENAGRVIGNVVMLQGDEPTISNKSMNIVFEHLEKNPEMRIVNLIGRIRTEALFSDPNCIKVVADFEGHAMYMSRSPIPHFGLDAGHSYKQVCAIGFSRTALSEFSEMEPTKLEAEESIDMLRWLENGKTLNVVEIFEETHPVDVPNDILTVEKILGSRV